MVNPESQDRPEPAPLPPRSPGQEQHGSLSREQQRIHWLGSRGSSFRAAVLGVDDGLVSNFSLVMGVAGGTGQDPRFIVLAGVAGLLAGAFSMAAGEYISMRAQRDLQERQLELEAREHRELPAEETEELVLIYQAKGLTRQEAETVAERIMADPAVALDTHAREEFGLDPSQLVSPWGAALSSGVAFAAGAFVPILPYLILGSGSAFPTSIILSGGALVTMGALLAYFSGKRVWWGAARMLLAGGIAATVTFTIGSLIGVAVK